MFRNLDNLPFFSRKMGLRAGLAWGFGGVMLLLLLVAGLGLLTLDSYQINMRNYRTLQAASIQTIRLNSTLQAEALSISDMLVRQGTMLEDNYRQLNTLIENQILPALDSAVLNSTERDQLVALRNQHRALTGLFNEIVVDLKQQKNSEANALWIKDNDTLISIIISRSNRLAQDVTARAENNISLTNSQADTNKLILLGALLIALLLSGLVAWFTTHSILIRNKQIVATLGELNETKKSIETRYRAGEQVSRKVLGLASELKTTAYQQAKGSDAQFQAVTFINVSMSELSETATNITHLADQVYDTALQISAGSSQIEATAVQTANRSKQGLKAVEKTIEASVGAGQLYQQLLEQMNILLERNTAMRRVLVLLDNLSNETHLLALNAALEATGAGQAGERFRIVAHEVKDLAQRSRQSNREVVSIVEEFKLATSEAANLAQIGYQKSRELEQMAGQAGSVIIGMQEVAELAVQEASSISQQSLELQKLGEIIKQATHLQFQASLDAQQSLASLNHVAQENASGSLNVSETANNLEQISSHLNQTLLV